MEIEFDHAKRDKTLHERGLDFADAGKLFSGVSVTEKDTRHDYGEPRLITIGLLHERAVSLGMDTAWRGSPHYLYEVRQ